MIGGTPSPAAVAGLILAVSLSPESWLIELLGARGNKVIHLPAGTDPVPNAAEVDPDLIILSDALPDDGAAILCRRLLGLTGGDRAIVVECATPPSPARRHALLEAGAWVCVSPEDGDIVSQVALLEAFLRARRATARDRLGLLTDPRTGLYNRQGLTRRAQELGAQVFRTHDPVACLVFALHVEPDSEPAMAYCARVLHEEGRLSDVVARLDEREVAILAPGTDAEGALRLAERMSRTLRSRISHPESGGISLEMRAAFDVVPNFGLVATRPIDLVVQTASSLRQRGHSDSGPWIRRSGGHARIDVSAP